MHLDEDNQLLRTIRRLVKTIREDYQISGNTGLVRDRYRVYKSFYRVQAIPLTRQDKPIVFVDAGFHTFESDVVSLMIISIGACVRDEDGKLHYLNDLGDFITPEYFVLYSSWSEGNEGISFKIKVFPFEEGSLLFREDNAEEISVKLTDLFNSGLRRGVDRERLMRLHRRYQRYLERLLELSYALKIAALLGTRTINIVDGTLVRWFGLKYIGFFTFDGLDVLGIVLGKTRESIIERLIDTYGLVKTTKFTSIARARWIFRDLALRNQLGLYADSTPDKVEETAKLINSEIRPRYGDNIAEDIVYLFNRMTFKWSDIWSVRVPITTDGNIIMHFEAHSQRPVLYFTKTDGAIANTDVATEVFQRINYVIPQVMAYRTRSYGQPPYGFMEIDQHVRISGKKLRMLQDIIINEIRRETGETGHPLEYLFEYIRKIRLGY